MIFIDNDIAIEVTKNKIRKWRDAEFAKNDIDIQNALVDGTSTAEFVLRRDYLRDLPETCNGKTLEELKEILEGLSW